MSTSYELPPQTSLTADDFSHLNSLSICFKFFAALLGCGGFLPLIHITVGFLLATGSIPMENANQSESGLSLLIGGLFVLVGFLVMAMIFTFSFFSWKCGEWILKREKYVGVTICAAIACTSVPLGTLLGVFTLIVINRPQVKAEFERRVQQTVTD